MHPQPTHSRNNTISPVLPTIRELLVMEIRRTHTGSRSSFAKTASSLGRAQDRGRSGRPKRKTPRKILAVRGLDVFIVTIVFGRVLERLLDHLELLLLLGLLEVRTLRLNRTLFLTTLRGERGR